MVVVVGQNSIDPSSLASLARFLGMSLSWVYKAAERGQLPCVRIGSALRFDASAMVSRQAECEPAFKVSVP